MKGALTMKSDSVAQVIIIIGTLSILYIISETTELDIGTCDEQTSTWSSWNDRDDPSATGDWELLHLRPDAHRLCEAASGVQARVVGSLDMTTTQTVSLTLVGLSCINVQQADGCLDYEVRFCCPFPVGEFIRNIVCYLALYEMLLMHCLLS